MPNTHCAVCGNKIETAIMKGEDWCSGNCKKEIVDVSSVGMYAFVTPEEHKVLLASREPGMFITAEGLAFDE